MGEHKQEGDAWVVVRGRVFNISAYLDYHPVPLLDIDDDLKGGKKILLACAGKDATLLFGIYY